MQINHIERTLEVLEYTRVRETIALSCVSEEGREALSRRMPSASESEIELLKAIGRAWEESLRAENPPHFTGWPQISHFLDHLRIEGLSLDREQLFALGLFCESVTSFKNWADSRTRQIESARQDSLSQSGADRLLVTRARELPSFSQTCSAIFRVIDRGTGEIRDIAEIKAIKQHIRAIRLDIDRLLGEYLGDDAMRPMLQSQLPTIRDGRQVIAMRSNFKGRIKGIIHEVSQTGQTMYLEPEDVVERNNDLVAEESRLAREISRILKELTESLVVNYKDFVLALSEMVFFDGVHASICWLKETNSVFALPSTSGIELRQARHPLLGKKAVPIDLLFIGEARVLIVTGPNTGGKTVTLKTAALLALLNQTGWPIPCGERSSLPIFDYIGCDIGDEQSLDQSLSTFSGHMKNVAEILLNSTEKSLVLLDELGSGTDPQEGGAIAMAVLDTLLERGTTVLVTTHHGVLKNYGYTHPKCVNASVDFDDATLSPTYRIVMGVPGESHALDIASRNGINPEIIKNARKYILEEHADISALIKGLTAKHAELDSFIEEKKVTERTLLERVQKIETREMHLTQKEIELREQGYKKLQNHFEESRRQLENLVRELREGELSRDKTLQVKAWIAQLETQSVAEKLSLDAAKNDAAQMVREAKEKKSLVQPTKLCSGMEVFVGAMKRSGTLVRSAKKGFWIVATDSLRLTVSEDDITPNEKTHLKGQKKPDISIHVETDSSDDTTPSYELRLLGMRHDEALKVLDRQLDLASMKGLKEFSIIHGKGHGILQQAVHERLKTYASVETFCFARPELGGTGKTFVTMR